MLTPPPSALRTAASQGCTPYDDARVPRHRTAHALPPSPQTCMRPPQCAHMQRATLAGWTRWRRGGRPPRSVRGPPPKLRSSSCRPFPPSPTRPLQCPPGAPHFLPRGSCWDAAVTCHADRFARLVDAVRSASAASGCSSPRPSGKCGRGAPPHPTGKRSRTRSHRCGRRRCRNKCAVGCTQRLVPAPPSA